MRYDYECKTHLNHSSVSSLITNKRDGQRVHRFNEYQRTQPLVTATPLTDQDACHLNQVHWQHLAILVPFPSHQAQARALSLTASPKLKLVHDSLHLTVTMQMQLTTQRNRKPRGLILSAAQSAACSAHSDCSTFPGSRYFPFTLEVIQ